MRALFIQPDESESAGLIGAAMAERGVDLDYFVIQPDFKQTVGSTEFPDITDHDLIVVMGSPWSVYDEKINGWVDPLLMHLRKAVEADRPVLGICFGGQALAAAMGGTVAKGDESEFGWLELESESTVLCGPWFEFHQDVFTVPDEGEELARSAVGPQAFRLGRSLGVQFHPELDSSLLEEWYRAGDEGRLQRSGFDTVTVMAETKELEAAARLRARDLVDWFIDDIARL